MKYLVILLLLALYAAGGKAAKFRLVRLEEETPAPEMRQNDEDPTPAMKQEAPEETPVAFRNEEETPAPEALRQNPLPSDPAPAAPAPPPPFLMSLRAANEGEDVNENKTQTTASGVKHCEPFKHCMIDGECGSGQCALGRTCQFLDCIANTTCSNDTMCGGFKGACDVKAEKCDCEKGAKANGFDSYMDSWSKLSEVQCTHDDNCFGFRCTPGVCSCPMPPPVCSCPVPDPPVKCEPLQQCMIDGDCGDGQCALGRTCQFLDCLNNTICSSDAMCGGFNGACDVNTQKCDCDKGAKANGFDNYVDSWSKLSEIQCTNDDNCFGFRCIPGICSCLPPPPPAPAAPALVTLAPPPTTTAASGVGSCQAFKQCMIDGDCGDGQCTLGRTCQFLDCMTNTICSDDGMCGGFNGACDINAQKCDCDKGAKANGFENYVSSWSKMSGRHCTQDSHCFGFKCIPGVCSCPLTPAPPPAQ